MAVTLYVRGNRDVLLQVLRQLPAAISGHGPDPLGIAKEVREAAGAALLDEAKADAKDPNPETKRRPPRGPVKRPRGLLSDSQDARWRMLFATRRNWIMAKFGYGEEEASRFAARIAWAQLKAEGAPTKKAQREREAALKVTTPPGEVVLEGPPRLVPEASEVPASWLRRTVEGLRDGLVKAVMSVLGRFMG